MSLPTRRAETHLGAGHFTPWPGFFVASLVITVGTFWAFTRGAPDFAVFYAAWRLVLEGRGMEIYHATPDRFLYAPGFAWLLSPLGLLPRDMALALWCFAKAAVIGYAVREFKPRALSPLAGAGLAAWGVVILARPLMIDFQYGQVNVLIMGACIWALLGHFRSASPGALDFVRWAVLAIAALAKVFPLPLLIVPWFVRQGIPVARLRLERAGILAGLVLTLAVPMVSEGLSGTIALLFDWRLALISRGLPLESHNQSFAAVLNHYFSGEPTHIVAQGMVPILLGAPLLAGKTIALLSLAWVSASAGFLLAWIMSGDRRSPLIWISVVTAGLILPSHLVWKPYFVMAIPLAIVAVERARSSGRIVALALIFVAINFTGFDFLGHTWGAHMEAAAILLWSELALIALVLL